MLRLKLAHRKVLADKVPDAANVVLAGLVVGQALSERAFSLRLAAVGIAVWVAFIAAAVLISVQEES